MPKTIDALDFSDVQMGNVIRKWFGSWGVSIPTKEFIGIIKYVFPSDILPWKNIKAILLELEKASILFRLECVF